MRSTAAVLSRGTLVLGVATRSRPLRRSVTFSTSLILSTLRR